MWRHTQAFSMLKWFLNRWYGRSFNFLSTVWSIIMLSPPCFLHPPKPTHLQYSQVEWPVPAHLDLYQMVWPSSCRRKCRCFFQERDLTFLNIAPAFITWRSSSPWATVQDQGLVVKVVVKSHLDHPYKYSLNQFRPRIVSLFWLTEILIRGNSLKNPHV